MDIAAHPIRAGLVAINGITETGAKTPKLT